MRPEAFERMMARLCPYMTAEEILDITREWWAAYRDWSRVHNETTPASGNAR